MRSLSAESVATARAFRISPADTNYFAVLFDPVSAGIESIFVIEIFAVGGATPPNRHSHAHEFFYVIAGEGIARCGDEMRTIRQGDALLLPPGVEHVVRNTGAGKLYTLTVMTPNEGFSELIRAGVPVVLDDEDLRVLGGGMA
jgi:mannose-6-phosphate isomerase-like protein (cupin superfamily)